MKHTGPPHAGGAITTCDLCKAIARDIVRRALAKRGKPR